MKDEMTAFVLRETAFRRDLAFCPGQQFLNGGVRAKRQGLLPTLNCVTQTVSGELGISEDSESIGGIRGEACRLVRVRNSVERVPRAHQKRRIIIQHGGILRITAQCGFKITARVVEPASLELSASGDVIGEGDLVGIAARLYCGECAAVNLMVTNNLVEQLVFPAQVRIRRQGGKIGNIGNTLRRACARLNALNARLGDGEAVITDFVSDAVSGFPGLVRIDYVAIFQADDFSRGREGSNHGQYKPEARDDKYAHLGAF